MGTGHGSLFRLRYSPSLALLIQTLILWPLVGVWVFDPRGYACLLMLWTCLLSPIPLPLVGSLVSAFYPQSQWPCDIPDQSLLMLVSGSLSRVYLALLCGP